MLFLGVVGGASNLSFGEHGHDLRGGRIETDNVEHSLITGIGNSKAVGLHADDDQFSIWLTHFLAVAFQGGGRVGLSEPRFIIGVDDEDVELFYNEDESHMKRACKAGSYRTVYLFDR